MQINSEQSIISSLFFTKDGIVDLKKIRVDQLENVEYLNFIKDINRGRVIKISSIMKKTNIANGESCIFEKNKLISKNFEK